MTISNKNGMNLSEKLLTDEFKAITYSQRNFLHYAYWILAVFVGLACLAGFLLIYFEDGTLFISDQDVSYTFYSIKFTVKLVAFGKAVPILLWPPQICNYNDWFSTKDMSNDFNLYWLLIGLCTYAVATLTSIEIIFLIYFSVYNYKIYSHINNGVFACEVFCILYQLYLTIYRLFGKSAFDFWQATFGDISHRPKPIKSQYFKYEERLYPDKFHKNCYGKIRFFLHYLIIYPIWSLVKWTSVLIFLIIVGVGLIVGMLYFLIKVVLLGTIGRCLCNKRRNKFFLDIKRYSYKFDYILFHILLYTFKYDKFYAYFVQNAPFKYYLNSIIIYFFQQRYLGRFLKGDNVLPNQNLLCPDHTSYHVLIDNGNTTYTRWLPPRLSSNLPSAELVMEQLFLRKRFIPETHMNLSVLSAFYVRFFTHQFTDTHPTEWNHLNEPIGLNLMQIYGSNKENEELVRNTKKDRHLLKSTIINNEEFPVIKMDKNDNKKYFITPLTAIDNVKIFRKNSPDYYMIYILFFRHHQYIARSLKHEYPVLDEHTIFDMTRLINILTMIKCTLALYGDIGVVQSTVPSNFSIYDFEHLLKWWVFRLIGPINQLFPSNASTIPIEFNILYRWHQLIPDSIPLIKYNIDNDEKCDDDEEEEEEEELTLPYPNAVDLLTRNGGLETMLLSCSESSTGKITLQNTSKLLAKMAVLPTIKKGRYYNLASFNDYREHFGFSRYNKIEEISDDEDIVNALKQVYNNDVDKIEFYVGIFAEEKIGRSLHGTFTTALFSSCIITLLTSTPLLRKDWNKILTPLGKQMVDKFLNFGDLVQLHTKLKGKEVKTRTV